MLTSYAGPSRPEFRRALVRVLVRLEGKDPGAPKAFLERVESIAPELRDETLSGEPATWWELVEALERRHLLPAAVEILRKDHPWDADVHESARLLLRRRGRRRAISGKWPHVDDVFPAKEPAALVPEVEQAVSLGRRLLGGNGTESAGVYNVSDVQALRDEASRLLHAHGDAPPYLHSLLLALHAHSVASLGLLVDVWAGPGARRHLLAAREPFLADLLSLCFAARIREMLGGGADWAGPATTSGGDIGLLAVASELAEAVEGGTTLPEEGPQGQLQLVGSAVLALLGGSIASEPPTGRTLGDALVRVAYAARGNPKQRGVSAADAARVRKMQEQGGLVRWSEALSPQGAEETGSASTVGDKRALTGSGRLTNGWFLCPPCFADVLCAVEPEAGPVWEARKGLLGLGPTSASRRIERRG